MIQTNTQYMSDPARAERTIRRFLNITLREMEQVQTQNYTKYITDKLVLTEGLSQKKIQNMTYIELACLIHNMGGKPQYDGYNYDSRARQLTYYQFVASILKDGKQRSISVRLFMALPLKAFYDCLERISCVDDLSKEFADIRSQCRYQDGYTIGDFLEEKLKTLYKTWRPVIPLSTYEHTIKTALKDIGRLLIDSLYMAFPQQFQAAEICRKYSFAFEEEGIAHPMFYPADDEEPLPM